MFDAKLLYLSIISVLFSACSLLYNRAYPVSDDCHVIQPEGTVYIPSGIIGTDTTIHIQEFWMLEKEVTNKEYRTFLESLNSEEDKILALPDTTCLNNQLWISKHRSYILDPMFDDFPVVGLTKEQMLGYAKWLSDKATSEFPIGKYTFRLPTKYEWQHAAFGGSSDSNNFPMGMKARNPKGCYYFHFFDPTIQSRIGQKDSLRMLETLHDSIAKSEYAKLMSATKSGKKIKRKHVAKSLVLIGLPVFSNAYFPNNYGLYNMSGNVAEMTESGEILGGSFRTTADHCKIRNGKIYPYDKRIPQADVGFRLVCTRVPCTYK